MALFFVYRLRGGEVVSVSVNSNPGIDTTYFAEVQDPALPDGADLQPPKIATGSPVDTVRDATAGEITAFAAAAQTDADNKLNLLAKQYVDTVPGVVALVMQALALLTMDELNILRADNNINLPARTEAQVRTGVKNKIDELVPFTP